MYINISIKFILYILYIYILSVPQCSSYLKGNGTSALLVLKAVRPLSSSLIMRWELSAPPNPARLCRTSSCSTRALAMRVATAYSAMAPPPCSATQLLAFTLRTWAAKELGCVGASMPATCSAQGAPRAPKGALEGSSRRFGGRPGKEQ